jgi:hypothetical protein
MAKTKHNSDIFKPTVVTKPCHTLRYCPYGQLVEDFPLEYPNKTLQSCTVFGHNCPVYSVAEDFIDVSVNPPTMKIWNEYKGGTNGESVAKRST